MTTRRSTKAALLSSALALFLCITMLMGTTFAWFTDSVTSANNVIQAGNLDVELEYWDEDQGKYVPVTSTTKLFDDAALWEPGYTEVAYLKVSNKGSLALKYQLNVNVVKETLGKTEEGATIKLSDHLVFGVAEKQITAAADLYTRESAITAAGSVKGLKTYNGETKALPNTNDAHYVALIIYMPTDVGNAANHDGTNIPQIEMGVNVLATQLTAEEDSFDNQYDANAPYSVWDGVVPAEMPETLVVDGETQTVHVKDAAAFAYLSTLSAKWVELYTDGAGTTYTNYANGAGSNYYYSGDWSVSLEADIDLNNHALAPVAIVFGESTGATAFNGNYHTIRNINATTGLFADDTRATYANLVLENVKATNGALTGFSRHPITNVTVKNATVSGTDYVGGLTGKAYSNVTGCQVIDSTIVATGKEAGGLIGYAEAGTNTLNIECNTVRNVSVYAGLIAQPNVNIKVHNNVIDTVTVGAEDLSQYQCGAVVSNALAPENVYDNTVTNANVVTNVTFADTTAGLNDAVAAGDETIVLAPGTYTMVSGVAGKDITITGTKDTVIDAANTYLDNSTVAFEGVTIKVGLGYAAPGASDYAGIYSPDAKFTNCTFEGGLRVGRDGAIFENCTFNLGASDYVYNYGNSATFINCTFNSKGKALISYSDGNGTVPSLVVKGCVFNATQEGYAGAIANQPCAAVEIDNYGCGVDLVLEGNTVGENFSGQWRIKSYNASGDAITVNGTPYTSLALDGKTMTIDTSKNVTVVG